MKKKTLKIMMTTLLVGMMGISMMGCGSNESEAGNTAKSSEEISGSLTLSGSSALLPLMEQSIDKFNEKYPDVEISAQAGGSGTGLTQVSDGSVDIGNSDVFAKDILDGDKADGLEDHQVVAQGFGIVVNKALGITNLTKAQIKDIFSGKITNWSSVGGPDKEILVVHRKAGSGTRATFEETVLDKDVSLENDSIGIMQDSNGAVLKAMTSNEGAISYVGLSYMNNDEAKGTLSLVSIDGVAADKDNICNGTYKFWSYGHMYTKGQAKSPAKEFIDFISSEDNKDSLENLGFIPSSEIKVK